MQQTEKMKEAWPIGLEVIRRDDLGMEHLTRTRSKPWLLGEDWVVNVEGIAGGYQLSRMKKRDGVFVATRDDLLENGQRRYGEHKADWVFKCDLCGRHQSATTIRRQMNWHEVASERFGFLEPGHPTQPELYCYSPTCDFVANGLFTAPVLLVGDPTKPFHVARMKNCTHIFEWGQGRFAGMVSGECSKCDYAKVIERQIVGSRHLKRYADGELCKGVWMELVEEVDF